jgi:hypothetical protein
MGAEFCRIERWHGYVSSSFYVRLPDRTVLESSSFRWRHAAPPPEGGSARAAYDELAGRLEAAGWTRHADGAYWFATTFARQVDTGEEIVSPPPADVVPPQPPPVRILQPAPEPERPQAQVIELDPPGARDIPASRRRAWVAPVVAGALVIAALGTALTLRSGKDPMSARDAAAQTRVSAVAGATESLLPPPAPTPAATKRVVDLRIAAHGNGSWLEVRRNSASGPVLYSATLTDGKSLHLRGPRLWARFGAASNLTIVANRRALPIQGTYEKLFVPSQR